MFNPPHGTNDKTMRTKNNKTLLAQAVNLMHQCTTRNAFISLLQPQTDAEKRIKAAYRREESRHIDACRYVGDRDGYTYMTAAERRELASKWRGDEYRQLGVIFELQSTQNKSNP